jgi:hypothetical protein
MQERSIYYAATDAKTCLAEFFQHTRRIDRAAQSPWLAVFELAQSLDLIDLTGDFATRMGASMEIQAIGRSKGNLRSYIYVKVRAITLPETGAVIS